MKNIQEILLECGGKGKLILGNEEIDVSVFKVKSKVRHLSGYRRADGTIKGAEYIVLTSLEICLFGDDFFEVKEEKS